MIKLVELYEIRKYSGTKEAYHLREVFVNPEHVVCLREDHKARTALTEGNLPQDLDNRQSFTKIHMNRGQNGIDITVVGSPTTIEEQLKSGKQLLRG